MTWPFLYSFALSEGRVYDLFAGLHTALGDSEVSKRWTATQTRLLALAS
ncbi:hypothetical protein [Streptomyces caatingaensis]|nr:hypothetical protein [Streptomyces caatingaensis]